MNQQQMEAARESMADWLAHPQELGKEPARLECAGEFALHGMKYYIFKYKKSILGKWLLGVCGGFEGDSLEHCGHVYSEMEEYREATARVDAEAIVESVRSYWMERAEEEDREGGPFVSFVLLDACEWDKEQFIEDLEREWGIVAEEQDPGDLGLDGADDPEDEEDEDGLAGLDEGVDNDYTLVFAVDGMLASVALMPGPVPDGEAEHYAAANYLWPDAVEVTKTHVAHLVVAVLPGEEDCDLTEGGKLLVKLTDACLLDEGALGVYTAGTVFQPELYREGAAVMREGELPIPNLVYFGIGITDQGVRYGYTYGLEAFAHDEIEVVGTEADLEELRNFLFDIAAYLLSTGAVLRDGETIGFSAEEKLPITRSPGVNLDGETLKIGYRIGGAR